MREAFVYLIGSEANPALKIGFTNNSWRRLTDLQHVLPYRLRLLEEWRFPSRPFAYAVEQAAHAMLWQDRMSGEWFNVPVAEAGRAVDQAQALVQLATANFNVVDCLERDVWLHVVAKLGLKPGARAAGMSVPGFIKARDRARAWKEMQDAKRKR